MARDQGKLARAARRPNLAATVRSHRPSQSAKERSKAQSRPCPTKAPGGIAAGASEQRWWSGRVGAGTSPGRLTTTGAAAAPSISAPCWPGARWAS